MHISVNDKNQGSRRTPFVKVETASQTAVASSRIINNIRFPIVLQNSPNTAPKYLTSYVRRISQDFFGYPK